MRFRLWSQGLANWRNDPPRLLIAQLDLISRNLQVTLRASALAAWGTAAAFAYLFQRHDLMGWAGLVTACSVIGYILDQRLAGLMADQAEKTPNVYRVVMCGLCLCMGSAWGLLPVLFVSPNEVYTLHLVIVVLIGVSSAGLVGFGSVWPLAVIFWLSCMAPLVVTLLAWQDTVMLSIGLFGLLYLVAMATYAFHAGESLRLALKWKLDNEDLVGRLTEQSSQAQQAREQAEAALGAAGEADRARTLFLASASHDLRQPLHAAGLFLGSLARSGLNARQAMLVEHAQASNTAASEMLNTLLDFSKVDAGMVQPKPQSFALQPLFHKLERELAPWAADKQLNLRMRDTNVTPFADPGLVELILRNLMLNAIRYTERGGILLACRKRSGQALIEVWDTGIGIPVEEHQTIFEAFQQLHNPERDRRNGLGLGLAIVHGLAKAMGVPITVSSVSGRGSVFKLTLPLGLTPVKERQVSVNKHDDLRGMRVLLVEDDEGVRLAMADLMGVWGVQCEVAGSIKEAIERLAYFVPEVVLADYRLRSTHTGAQAVSAIRQHLGFDVPAALVTGDTASERLNDAHIQGLALIHKPVPAAHLHALLLDLRSSCLVRRSR